MYITRIPCSVDHVANSAGVIMGIFEAAVTPYVRISLLNVTR